MSVALPTSDPCCLTSCETNVVQIAGPIGPAGVNGTNGTNGISAVTTLTADHTMPPNGTATIASVASTAWMVIGGTVFVQGLGTMEVVAINSSLTVTLKNVEDTGLGIYANNAVPGTVAPIGSRVGATGLQGPAGIITGTAGGDLKGTYPNPKLLIPNSLGALAVGNGTDAASLSAGTNGQIPAYDNTQPLGLLPKSIIPITGGTNVATDRIVRLSTSTGLPIPLAASKAALRNPGGAGLLVGDATAGNARGTDAVDLQVSRGVTGVTGVASGNQSVIVGGQDNTASGERAVVVGGEVNLATGAESFIGGGDSNEISADEAAIVGGSVNHIAGGGAIASFIGGGQFNSISGGLCAIGGGSDNQVFEGYSVIGGGAHNECRGLYSAVLGGISAKADKFGQRAFSAGSFAATGDCQQIDLIWRITTIGIIVAPGTEMFLDGAGGLFRAIIASGTTWAFNILLTARSSLGLNAAWTVQGVINNLAGATTIATAVVNTLLADNSGATFGTLANVPVVSADTGNDALVINVKNPAATDVRWAAHGRILEIHY